MYYFGPAHTDGDSFIHFENTNIVHMGDLMFNRRHPFVDRSAGANIKNWIKVLHRATRKFTAKQLTYSAMPPMVIILSAMQMI